MPGELPGVSTTHLTAEALGYKLSRHIWPSTQVPGLDLTLALQSADPLGHLSPDSTLLKNVVLSPCALTTIHPGLYVENSKY